MKLTERESTLFSFLLVVHFSPTKIERPKGKKFFLFCVFLSRFNDPRSKRFSAIEREDSFGFFFSVLINRSEREKWPKDRSISADLFFVFFKTKRKSSPCWFVNDLPSRKINGPKTQSAHHSIDAKVFKDKLRAEQNSSQNDFFSCLPSVRHSGFPFVPEKTSPKPTLIIIRRSFSRKVGLGGWITSVKTNEIRLFQTFSSSGTFFVFVIGFCGNFLSLIVLCRRRASETEFTKQNIFRIRLFQAWDEIPTRNILLRWPLSILAQFFAKVKFFRFSSRENITNRADRMIWQLISQWRTFMLLLSNWPQGLSHYLFCQQIFQITRPHWIQKNRPAYILTSFEPHLAYGKDHPHLVTSQTNSVKFW